MFKLGDLVRVGGRISEVDQNYHKRGIVKDYVGPYPVVEMIDPFEGGGVTVNWLSDTAWELCQSSTTVFNSLL